MLSFDIMHGDQRPFSTPNEVVLTARTARRFVQDDDLAELVGKQFTFFTSGNKLYDVICTAIAYDPTYRSTLQFEALLPFVLLEGYRESGVLDEQNALTFVMLENPGDLAVVEHGLPGLAKRIFAKEIDELRAGGKWSKEADPYTLHAAPFSQMYTMRTPGDQLEVMPWIIVWIVGVLGGLVLVVGCVNFTVLSLGRSVYRSKEIGLRKVVGALRTHLIAQHVIEAITLCAISMVTGVALADYLLPQMSALFPIPSYALGWSHTPIFWAFLILLPIMVGILAGFYPAYMMSKVEPVVAIKGGMGSPRKGRFARWLVVVQFAATIFLLATTQVVLEQFDYGHTL